MGKHGDPVVDHEVNELLDVLENFDVNKLRDCDKGLVRRLSLACKILAARCDYWRTDA